MNWDSIVKSQAWKKKGGGAISHPPSEHKKYMFT